MKLISLFSGIGGLDIGVRSAFSHAANIPLQHALLCEKDSFCRSVLDRHFPGVKIHWDVTKLSTKTAEIKAGCDVVTMGFPCQDASIIQRNPKGLKGHRTGLFHDGWRVAMEANAKIIIMENVSAFSNRGAKEVKRIANAAEYEFESMVVSAAHFGAPHLRKRWMGIAWRDTDLIQSGWSSQEPIGLTSPDLPTYSGKTFWPTLRAGKPNGGSVDRFIRAKGQGKVSTPHAETALRLAHREKYGNDTDVLKMSIEWAERLMGFPKFYTRIDGHHVDPNPHVCAWGSDWIESQDHILSAFRRYQPSKRLKALGNAVVPAWAYFMVSHVLRFESKRNQLDLFGEVSP